MDECLTREVIIKIVNVISEQVVGVEGMTLGYDNMAFDCGIEIKGVRIEIII